MDVRNDRPYAKSEMAEKILERRSNACYFHTKVQCRLEPVDCKRGKVNKVIPFLFSIETFEQKQGT